MILVRKILFVVAMFLYITTLSAEPSPTLIALEHNVKYSEDYPHDHSILWMSNDFGMNWMTPTIGQSSQANLYNTQLISMSCTEGPHSACYAVGWDNSLDIGKPVLLMSADSGNTWSKLVVPYALVPIKISCTGSESKKTTCAILTHRDGEISIITNHEGGEYFGIKQMVRPYMADPFLVSGDVSCSGHDEGARCVFVSGIITKKGYEPIIYVNDHKSDFWKQKPIKKPSKSGMLWQVDCAGNGNKTLCAAIGGETQLTGKAIMLVSQNGGNTWHEPKVVNHLSQDKQLSAVSCVNNSSANFCVAGGASSFVHFDASAQAKPFFIINTDGHWRIQSPQDIQKYHGYISDLSCTATYQSSLCVATGLRDPETETPLLLVSKDQGETWTIKTISQTPKKLDFIDKVNCVSNLDNATCFVTGGSWEAGSTPLIVSSNDMGETWDVPTFMPLQKDSSISSIAAAY